MDLERQLEIVRQGGGRIVTTCGCFDLIHSTHVAFLRACKAQGDCLVVGLNSDRSVRQLKGPSRPVNPAHRRAAVLQALEMVDHVVIFDDTSPLGFLDRVRPDIHCKGEDYLGQRIPEEGWALSAGAEVRILSVGTEPTSSELLRALEGGGSEDALEQLVRAQVLDGAAAIREVAWSCGSGAADLARRLRSVLGAGGKVMVCGNGGSAADAQHFVGELVGRFQDERPGMAALCLSSDPVILTAVANDYGYDQVFARQVEAHGRAGDLLIVISTSGLSRNVLEAARRARSLGIGTVALTGAAANPLAELSDLVLGVPALSTWAIQQGHGALLHAVCAAIDHLAQPERSSALPLPFLRPVSEIGRQRSQ